MRRMWLKMVLPPMQMTLRLAPTMAAQMLEVPMRYLAMLITTAMKYLHQQELFVTVGRGFLAVHHFSEEKASIDVAEEINKWTCSKGGCHCVSSIFFYRIPYLLCFSVWILMLSTVVAFVVGINIVAWVKGFQFM